MKGFFVSFSTFERQVLISTALHTDGCCCCVADYGIAVTHQADPKSFLARCAFLFFFSPSHNTFWQSVSIVPLSPSGRPHFANERHHLLVLAHNLALFILDLGNFRPRDNCSFILCSSCSSLLSGRKEPQKPSSGPIRSARRENQEVQQRQSERGSQDSAGIWIQSGSSGPGPRYRSYL